MKNIFNQNDTADFIQRINKLTPSAQPLWGKMNVAQMLAHCNVTYELIYDNKHKKPNPVMKFILKKLVKNKVVSDVPYKRSTPTAPVFKVSNNKDFNTEKDRLINYINKTFGLGEGYFDNKESHSFGKLTITEWNNMLGKHLDHHLRQFGV